MRPSSVTIVHLWILILLHPVKVEHDSYISANKSHVALKATFVIAVGPKLYSVGPTAPLRGLQEWASGEDHTGEGELQNEMQPLQHNSHRVTAAAVGPSALNHPPERDNAPTESA